MMKDWKRLFTLLSLLLLLFSGVATQTSRAKEASGGDRVVIEKRRIVIVRKGQFVRDFPERRRAIINYPVIKGGLTSPLVLRKVRSLLQFKNIFDTSLAEYRADTWLSEFDYQVNYNENFILDITFTQEGVGAYPDSQSKHFAINLRNGELIRARDVFKPAAIETLLGLVNRKLQDEIQESRQALAEQPETSAEERQRFEELFAGLKFAPENLDEFSINNKGITFLYDAGFPHAIQALEPVGQYFFSYDELRPYFKPEGQLGRFVQ